jgi:hypothetical protein
MNMTLHQIAPLSNGAEGVDKTSKGLPVSAKAVSAVGQILKGANEAWNQTASCLLAAIASEIHDLFPDKPHTTHSRIFLA